uniref:Uncharacterized protein n=1 Tax=Anguilla anguilla TaxID=7936 RepID=A0A0E9XYY6_ANGAN
MLYCELDRCPSVVIHKIMVRCLPFVEVLVCVIQLDSRARREPICPWKLYLKVAKPKSQSKVCCEL